MPSTSACDPCDPVVLAPQRVGRSLPNLGRGPGGVKTGTRRRSTDRRVRPIRHMVDVQAPMASQRTRRHPRRARAGLLAAAIGLTALLTAAVPAASPAPEHERQIWIATRTTVGRLEAVDPGIARTFFDDPTAF